MSTDLAPDKAAIAPAGPDAMGPAPFRLRQTARETHDTVTLEVEPVGPGDSRAWAPGQFNMLYLFGVGEVPISVSGDPTEPRALRHTVRAVGAVTNGLCRLRRGQVLGVRGPFGRYAARRIML